ncbi:Trypsin domain protein [beta proteobacterium KB13]|uniref:Trypsin domain protein n=1 Tax=beta proteobacterium KB13 TaxID=314607 RepID=B6BWJ8_9PROT|nr:Trypsin domain protein [beta proteobacterium KB13]
MDNHKNMKKILLLIVTLLFPFLVFAYPAQHELFELNKSMIQLWVSYEKGVTGTGSGVVIKKNHVATDCHVFQNATGVNVVKYHDTYSPIGVYADWEHDICVLKFDNLPLEPVEVRQSESIHYEEEVFTLTFPNDNPVPLPSYGKVKALYNFDKGSIIRTSATFTVGSSGGALFDNDFNLIGITTFKSPGKRLGYFYCLPTEWIDKVMQTKMLTDIRSETAPFWALPDEQKPFFMQVVLPLQDSNWAELKRIAKMWTQSEDDSTNAWFYLGLAEKEFNRDFAKLFLNKSISLNPRNLDALEVLYELSSEEGDDESIKKYRSMIEDVDPDHFVDHNSQV